MPAHHALHSKRHLFLTGVLILEGQEPPTALPRPAHSPCHEMCDGFKHLHKLDQALWLRIGNCCSATLLSFDCCYRAQHEPLPA